MNLRLLGLLALIASSSTLAADYTMRTGTLTFAGQQQGEQKKCAPETHPIPVRVKDRC